MTSQVSEITPPNQQVAEIEPPSNLQVAEIEPPNQQVSEVTPLHVPQISVAEPTQHSVLGLPIVHLSLVIQDPPWAHLTQRGLLPMAETICHSSQTFAGRLSLFSQNWETITQDTWVIQTVTEGYHIPLTSAPNQYSFPPTPHLSSEDTAVLEEEIKSLLQKQAVCQIPPPVKGFYSNMFIVPKKDGGQRPVINLKYLNKHVKSEHFKMEGLHTVKALLRREDFMAKVDLKDAFFMVPIAPQFRHLLLFKLKEKIYQFNCLPFGLCTAPRVFTKILKPAMEMLRSLSIRLVVYMDDMLLMAESRQKLTEHVQLTLFLLENLGFVVNSKKSILVPSQEIEFLGMIVNSISMDLKLPGEKIRKIRQEAHHLLNQTQPTAQLLSQLLGKLNATSPALQMAPLFCRSLQICLKKALSDNQQNYQAVVQLSPQALEDLQWWELHLSSWNGKSLITQSASMTITSDASLQGWGATCNGNRTRGPWSPSEQSLHINCLELLAATLAVQTFAKEKSGILILLQLDNSTVVAYINRRGGGQHHQGCLC